MTRQQAIAEREAFNAFCDGKEIQWRFTNTECWFDCPDPQWEYKFDHRIKPQPKMIALGPEDVPPGSVFRKQDWPHGCHRAYSEVTIDGVDFGSRHVSWEQVRNLEILRPGGNWQRAEKEETK